MDGLKKIGFLICAAMVLMVYLKQLLPMGRNAGIVKIIISVFVLFSISITLKETNWNNLLKEPQLVIGQYSLNDEIAQGLLNEYNRFLKEQEIQALVIELHMMQQESIEIKNVVLEGKDAAMGAKLLSARYQIKMENIEVRDEW